MTFRATKRKLEQIQNEKSQRLVKINEATLETERSIQILKKYAKRREELLVAENFVRLDVKRLRDMLYLRADEVYTLENRKIQLKLSMEERRHQIQVHKDALRAQLRTTEEERSRRAKELADKLIKVQQPLHILSCLRSTN